MELQTAVPIFAPITLQQEPTPVDINAEEEGWICSECEGIAGPIDFLFEYCNSMKCLNDGYVNYIHN